MTAGWLAAVLVCGVADAASAHEVRPAYLELRQATAAETFDLVWRVPAGTDGRRLAIDVALPPQCGSTRAPRGEFVGTSFVERWSARCSGGWQGATIAVAGLEATMTDVLVRLERRDGTTQVARLTPASPSFVVASVPDAAQVAATYLRLGVEHILWGADHLLFVLGSCCSCSARAGSWRRSRRSRSRTA